MIICQFIRLLCKSRIYAMPLSNIKRDVIYERLAGILLREGLRLCFLRVKAILSATPGKSIRAYGSFAFTPARRQSRASRKAAGMACRGGHHSVGLRGRKEL